MSSNAITGVINEVKGFWNVTLCENLTSKKKESFERSTFEKASDKTSRKVTYQSKDGEGTVTVTKNSETSYNVGP